MGDDVICIDSDDDDEDDANAAGRTHGARAGSRRAGGRGYWQQRRRAQRARRKLDSGGPDAAPLAALLDGLRRLSSEMSFGAVPCHSVAQRVHRLIGEFERSSTPLPVADRQEGWRQVLRLLLVLRAVGGFGPGERDRQEVERQTGNRPPNNKRRQSCHRYQLTVIDILVDYIRFRCETVTTRRPPPTPGVLLQECNRIVSHLFVIFAGNVELVTLTLLRTTPEQPGYTVLLYPVFETILTGEAARGDGDDVPAAGGIPAYVRLLLCFKRWRSLVTGRADKAVIDARAGQFLPARCPTIQAASDVPLLRLLPPVPPARRANETRYLLANDLFSLDQCIAQFFRHHRRASAAADERQLSNVARPAPPTMATRLTAVQLGSHYINVALLAELIERKGHLWARAFPASLAQREEKKEVQKTPSDRGLLTQEAHSIVESLRLIFRQRTEFIELTLLHVPAMPEHAPLLAPVFAAFLATPADSQPSTSTRGPLTIYRTNDVETYARLILCYAKWKALYRALPDAPEPTEWTRIDAMALSQLPFDCPRVLCPRDARLRNVFMHRQGSHPIGEGVVTPAGRTHHTVTGTLLRTIPNRTDLQELCLKFIEVYRGGMEDVEPREGHQSEDSMLTCSAAYKSMSTLIDRTDHGHPDGDICAATSAQHSRQEPGTGIGAEMKPIIIPHSDDGDETSAGDTRPESDQSTPPPAPSSPCPVAPATISLCTVAVAGSAGAERSDRNASNTPLAGESVADAAAALCWPPFVECFLNTPPATPQQEVVSEPTEEDHRRSLPVKKPLQKGAASWCRLKGTVRSIGRRKKRTTVAMTVAVRRALKRVFDDGDGGGGGAGCWWSFADVLAVQIPFPVDVRWCSSIMKVPLQPADGCAVDTAHLTPAGRLLRQEAHAASNNPREHSSHPRPSAPDDALLLELIGCLDAPDGGMSSDWTPSGCVDFAIPPDNPGRADRSQPNTVDDRASPCGFGGPVDTAPLFASGSDRFVHLLTALGPASWPIG